MDITDTHISDFGHILRSALSNFFKILSLSDFSYIGWKFPFLAIRNIRVSLYPIWYCPRDCVGMSMYFFANLVRSDGNLVIFYSWFRLAFRMLENVAAITLIWHVLLDHLSNDELVTSLKQVIDSSLDDWKISRYGLYFDDILFE